MAAQRGYSIGRTHRHRVEEGLLLERQVLALAAGDVDAMEPLYERTHAAVYGFALSIIQNIHDAQDVMQDTYVRIYQAAGTYRPCGNPLPWMLAIARNLALMRIRAAGRFCELPETLADVQAAQALNDAERCLLSALLGTLSEAEQQLVFLHAAAGLKHREVAALFDWPLSTVLSKYHRAIHKLRKQAERPMTGGAANVKQRRRRHAAESD